MAAEKNKRKEKCMTTKRDSKIGTIFSSFGWMGSAAWTKLMPFLMFTLLLSLDVSQASARTSASALQTRKANWDNLKGLAPGDEIKIAVKNGKSETGTLRGVTEDGIVVRLASENRLFERQSISAVFTKHEGHRARHALIGTLVGAGAGLAIGAVSDARDRNNWILPDIGKAVFTPAGAAVGVAVGGLLPSGSWRKIYEAR